MDPPEPIHGVIGVDRALGLRVTVKRTSSNVLLGGHSSHTTNPEKNIQISLNVKSVCFLFQQEKKNV